MGRYRKKKYIGILLFTKHFNSHCLIGDKNSVNAIVIPILQMKTLKHKSISQEMSWPAFKESSPDFRVGAFLSVSPFFVHMTTSQPPACVQPFIHESRRGRFCGESVLKMMDAVHQCTFPILVDSITLWMKIHLVCVFICKYMYTLSIRDNEPSYYAVNQKCFGV